jgi:hypothetical protein
LLCAVSVDEVLARPTQHNLSCHGYLRMFLEADRAL